MLYLASKSPRRKEILKIMNIPFELVPSDVEESEYLGEPKRTVVYNSELKAIDASSNLDSGFVLGSDTIVYLDNQIILKPKSKSDAKNILLSLKGNTHEVYTGVTIVHKDKNKIVSKESNFVVTKVTFSNFSDIILDYYLDNGDYMDKAGAYGIQDLGAILIEKIDGCYYNVMGLPIHETLNLLEKTGYFRSFPLHF